MNSYIELPNGIKYEDYHLDEGTVLAITQDAKTNGASLSDNCTITPRQKAAGFTGANWPYSNVEPAMFAALGLFYGYTERVNGNGELINDEIEYAVQNVLSGHAFGLFNCLPDDTLPLAAYGLSSFRLDMDVYGRNELKNIIKSRINRCSVVFIDEGNGQFDYLVWGYRDNGNILVGHKFEHGNDMQNCSFDFSNPEEFDFNSGRFSDTSLYKLNGEWRGGIYFYQPDREKADKTALYRQALAVGYHMLTANETSPAMDAERVHFGYGPPIYDAWISRLQAENEANSGRFYFEAPVFPHFLALHENRLMLHKFLLHYIESCPDENLTKAAELCKQLHTLAIEGAQIGYENEYSDPAVLAMTNNERRCLLIDILNKCRLLETEIAGCIEKFVRL